MMRARKAHRLEVSLDTHFIYAVDDWMRRHPDATSRSAAILRLAEIGMEQDLQRGAASDEGLRPDELNSENDG